MGLVPGDVIDAVATDDNSPRGVLDPTDTILISLTPGSPSQGALGGPAAIIQVFPQPSAVFYTPALLGPQASDDVTAMTLIDPEPEGWDVWLDPLNYTAYSGPCLFADAGGGPTCFDFDPHCDGLELSRSGDQITGWWRNTDCAGTDVEVVGRLVGGEGWVRGEVGGNVWGFVIDGLPLDGTMVMYQRTGGGMTVPNPKAGDGEFASVQRE